MKNNHVNEEYQENDIIQRLNSIESKIDSIKSQPKEEWLNTEQAAKFLGVTPRTMQTYRDLKHVRFSQFGREVRYKSSDLEEFLMEHYVKSANRIGGVL